MEETSIATRPVLAWSDVAPIAAKFGAALSFASDLPSERDQNFLLKDDSGPCVVFKVHNAAEDTAFLDCQNLALQRAAKGGARCQRLLQTASGEDMVTIERDGRTFPCRALSYLPGDVLAKAAERRVSDSEARTHLWSAVGRAVGSVTASLLDFDHPAAHRDFVWDLQHCERVIGTHQAKISDDKRRALVGRLLAEYKAKVAPQTAALRRSVVHNDPNDYNLVVDIKTDEVGVLDFGDMVHSYACADAAIGAAYLLLHCPADVPLVSSVCPFVQGFHESCKFVVEELDILFDLAVMRICTSVCMCAYQRSLEPDNEYLSISEKPAWAFLERLPVAADLDADRKAKVAKVDESEPPGHVLRRACGFPVSSL